ncbi:MAG: hypothetical protein IKE22_00025, partial [Atopobiaceae bacterium]|nr:hypothetical protein [Atopobiaceae bacterium]
ILEITAQESPHCTLRTMEAISYGRLLATTNRDVTNEPFYDKGQILTVNEASDLRRLKPMLVQWTPESFAGRDYFSPARLVARLRGLRAVA